MKMIRVLTMILLFGSCGLEPLKPLVPLGCRDIVPECVCDVYGQNCHWVWYCVR